MEKFTKLGLSKELTDVLKHAGFKQPTEIQEKAIPVAMAGKDIIGGSATGSGKTLAFASPIIENLKSNRNVQALILTPTRELAEQVAMSIRNFGVNKNLNVLAIYGGVNIDTQMRKIQKADVIVGTPGRVIDHLERRTLNLNKVKFLVLDEVDRMFDMGFSRDVEKIINFCPKDRQTMMFSATISPDIDYLARKYTRDAVEIAVKSRVDPTKLKQVYYDVPDNKKFSLLVHLLNKEESNFVLVFCSTRRTVDFVTKNLPLNGVKARAIHGGLDQKKRLRVLDEFKKKCEGVLVCTDVAARGLDIPGVSHVYNFDIPRDSKDYIHRIGRTARAGKNGEAVNILASRDYEHFSDVINNEGVEIKKLELPEVRRVEMVRDDSPRRVDSRSRDPSRGRDSRGPRGYGGVSRGPSRDSGRSYGRDSRGPSRDNRESRDGGRLPRGRESPRGGNYSRGSGDRRSEGRSYGRDSRGPSRGGSDSRGPRRDSRSEGRSYGGRDNNRRPDSRSDSRGSYSRGPSRDSRGGSSYGRDSRSNSRGPPRGREGGSRDSRGPRRY